MTRTFKSLCWAGALLGVSAADQAGWLERDAATTLYCLLPALTFMALTGRDQCRLRRREA